jgi:hypothetical protein
LFPDTTVLFADIAGMSHLGLVSSSKTVTVESDRPALDYYRFHGVELRSRAIPR